ncbi:MAG: rod shape-determining protein MreC [Treponema sp.]|jgi:rod shape-determining protein MreC|nr:rod shape-determining protein MreC [Treponema sp.]
MPAFIKKKLRFKAAEIILAFLILFSGIMLGFSGGGFVINFNKIGFSVVSVIQKGVHSVTSFFTGAVTSIIEFKDLKKDYNALTEKLANYELMQRTNADMRKENDRLKELLSFSEQTEYKNIPAQIIARDPDNLYSGITISKGIRNGIKKNMPVIAIQNGNIGVVGKVITVGLYTSMVMPVYDLKCNISGRIQNTRDIGLVSGKGSYSSPLNLNYIRKTIKDELNVGDIVVSSGENDNYIKDIPIGRISKIKELDYDSSLQIELDPFIDFMRLENVLVINASELNKKPGESK